MAIDIEWLAVPKPQKDDSNKTRLYPRIRKSRIADVATIGKEMVPYTNLPKTAVKAALDDIPEIIAMLLSQGDTVTIPALGTFRLAISSRNETFADTPLNKREAMVRSVNFKPSADFLARIGSPQFRNYSHNVTPMPATASSLITLLLAYLDTHESISRHEFQKLFGLKRSTACSRLKQLTAMGVIKVVGTVRQAKYVKA